MTAGSSGSYGARANAGGHKITVEGRIYVPDGATYIRVGDTNKAQSNVTAPTTKTGYSTYTDSTNTVWVKEPGKICSVYKAPNYTSFTDLDAALRYIPAGGTIMLTADFNYGRALAITDRKITFDLNTHKLCIGGTEDFAVADIGLTVTGSGQVSLADPGNGELNVTGVTYGLYAYGCKAEVTGATASGTSGAAAYAAGSGAEITAYGDLTVTGNSSNNCGALASSGKITVEGKINIPSGAKYINVGIAKTPSDITIPTTKEGYYTYAYALSTVWVKVPTFAPAITNADSYSCVSGTGGTFALTATGTSPITWSLSGPVPMGVTIAGSNLNVAPTVAAGTTYIFTVNAANGTLPNATQTFTLTVTAVATAPTIVSENNYSCMAGTGGTFALTATGTSPISWTLTGTIPAGVTLSGSTLNVASTVAAGTYSFTVGAANGVSPNAAQAFTLTVDLPHTHDFETAWTKDADGHWHACKNGGCTDKDSLAAHSPSDWNIDTAATAANAGSKHKECTVCGYVTVTEAIPATGGGGIFGLPWYAAAAIAAGVAAVLIIVILAVVLSRKKNKSK